MKSSLSPKGRPSAGAGRRRPEASGWVLYVAECADGSYYTGITKDVEKRIAAHNSGKGAKYTASRAPVKLLFQEPQAGYSAALRREYQVKKLSKGRKRRFIGGESLSRPSPQAKMSFQKNQKRRTRLETKPRRRKGKLFRKRDVKIKEATPK